MDELVQEAEELIEEIMGLLEDLPERAEEFADSVRDKVTDIGEFIEARQCVSNAQVLALQNMLAGIRRWLD